MSATATAAAAGVAMALLGARQLVAGPALCPGQVALGDAKRRWPNARAKPELVGDVPERAGAVRELELDATGR